MNFSRGVCQIGVTVLRSRIFWIVVVALLAHHGAIRSGWWIEDEGRLVEAGHRKLVGWHLVILGQRYGDTDADAVQVSIFHLLPQLAHELSGRLVGVEAWAFHFWNLAAHAGLCVLTFVTARQIFRRFDLVRQAWKREAAAFLAALLLAAHPLGTEAVHSIRGLGAVFTGLFLVWTVRRLLIFAEESSLGNLGMVALAVLLGILSSGPGTFLMLSGAFCCFWALHRREPGIGAEVSGRRGVSMVVCSIFASALVGYLYQFWGEYAQQHYGTQESRIVGHVLTQGRLFWESVSQLFVPRNLSAGHITPWSVSWSDWTASLGLASSLLGVALLCYRAFRKKRACGWSLVALMACLPLLVRFLHISDTPVVEARSYAALPWAALILSGGLVWFASRWSALRYPITAVIAGYFFLSCMQRSAIWTDPVRLAEETLRTDPLNLRMRVFLQERLYAQGQHTAVISSSIPTRRAYAEAVRYNNLNGWGRYYDLEEAFRARIDSDRLTTFSIAENFSNHMALAYADDALSLLQRDAHALNLTQPGKLDLVMLPERLAKEIVAASGRDLDALDVRQHHPLLQAAARELLRAER